MKILLVGTGGYAENYIRVLLENKNPDVIWEGIVDPYYAACPQKDSIDALGIPVYNTMDEFYAQHKADLAMICTPTYLHAEQSIFALSHGSHVLCEKPLAPTADEGRQMLEAEEKSGRFLAIGYQWSFAKAVQDLKRDILDGVFGKPLLLKTFVSWPRDRAYYTRGSGWGGKIRKNGKLLLDSIAANACAHYLHNMLFLLGETMETAAEVTNLRAECYRANAIENFDTCSILTSTAQGAKICFIASHAAGIENGPVFEYRFEKGVVRYEKFGARFIAEFTDGTEKDYGDPFEDQYGKLGICMDAVRGGTRPICTAKTALPHAAVIQQLYETVAIRDFAPEHIVLEGNTVVVKGLYNAMQQAYEKAVLYSETGNPIFR